MENIGIIDFPDFPIYVNAVTPTYISMNIVTLEHVLELFSVVQLEKLNYT